MRLALAVIVGILLFGCVPLLAQSERGTITGTVMDSTGAAVPGASITVTKQGTGASWATHSTDAGVYTVAELPVGEYSIQVVKEGFKTITRAGISLDAAAVVRVDFSLEIGGAIQKVEVRADVALLQTDTEKLSATVNNTMVEDLPLVVGGALRSPLDLAVLTPEANSFSAAGVFSVGGGQAKGYDITLDGVSMFPGMPPINSWITYNTPPVDAITEFTVSTNGFNADYGHASGGTMTFSSKSGTNALHGAAYDYLRNTDLDANYFFSNKQGLPRPIYQQNDFGVSAGGPVFIPKLFDGRKHSTYFFAAYEGFRNRVGATAAAATIPTPEMFTGDFHNWVNSSGKMIPIYDPTTQTTDASGNVTRTAYPNNQIPSSEFDPLVQKLISVYQSGGALPKPNNGAAPGTVGYVQNNYLITNGSVVTPWDKYSVKIDHDFSEKNKLDGYFGRNKTSNAPGPDGAPTLPFYYAGYQTITNTSYILRAGWTHTFTPTLVNFLYAGWNRFWQIGASAVEDMGNWGSKFCLPNVPDCNENLPNIGFGSDGYTAWGTNSKNGSHNPVISFNDDLNLVRARHSIKFGGMFQRNYYSGIGEQGIAGITNFSTTETGLPGVTNFSTGGGNSFASFLLGYVDSGRIDTPRFVGVEYNYFAGYIMDNFRVNNRLTVNYGLRWETTLPPVSQHDIFSNFSPTTPNPAAGGILGALVYAGYGPGRQNTRSLSGANFNGYGPRLGLAYTLNNDTVVRLSYSRSYGYVINPGGSDHYQGAFEIFQPTNSTSGVQPLFLFQNGFIPWPKPPSIDPSFANGGTVNYWQGRDATLLPANDQWEFSIQRQLPWWGVTIEAAYSGMKSNHLLAALDNINQTPYAALQKYGATLLNSSITSAAAVAAGLTLPFPTFTGSVSQSLRPYPQYTTIDTATGAGDHSGASSYHAAIFQVKKRFSDGLTLQASYVFSKLLTNEDTVGASGTLAMSQEHRNLEKSIGQFDLRHNVKAAWVYELPFGQGKKYFANGGFGGAVLGGWRAAAIQTYTAGMPVALATTISLPIFAGVNRPTISTYKGWGCSSIKGFDPSVETFFQPASSFGTQPSGVFGDATRYNPSCRQFPNYNENFSVNRTIKATERVNFELRLEAFNALNRVRFSTGSTTLQSSTFGKLSSNGDLLNSPRQVQVALRMRW